jgi:hypothetical protein
MGIFDLHLRSPGTKHACVLLLEVCLTGNIRAPSLLSHRRIQIAVSVPFGFAIGDVTLCKS